MSVSESTSHGSPPAVRPRVWIRPRKGWLSVNVGEIIAHHELLWFLTWRDIKIRYKQTVLGFLWAFLQPFIKMVVFSMVFGGIAKVDSEGFPYPIFLFAGLLPWQFFQESLSSSSQSVVGSAHVITKVYFPRLIVPLASVGGCLIDFAISFIILVGIMIYYGIAPTASAFMLAPLVVLTLLASLGVGIGISALNVAYRDFRYVIPFLTQIWMFLTPVIYPVKAVPDTWRWLLWLNPMGGVVEGFRAAILSEPMPWTAIAVSAGVSGVIFLVAILYFRRIERRFADII